MISRRFLLGAAPAALVAHSLPAIAKPLSIEISCDASTWGAGTAALDIRFAQQMLINGLTTVGELRDHLGLPALDLVDLLR
jgi:hypothetical protein